MRIAAATAIAVSALYFAIAPTSAEAAPQIRGNNCFSGVGSDEQDAKDECARAGFTCAAPKVMKCYFDNGRQMYICQCKDPPKKPKAYSGTGGRDRQTQLPEGEYRESKPVPEEQPPPEENEPQKLSASAHNC